jgi:hypothetical protein
VQIGSERGEVADSEPVSPRQVVTMNALASVLTPPSGFVTVNDREPVGAVAVALSAAVMLVALNQVVLLTVTPVPETVTFAPLIRVVPVIVTVTVVLRRSVDGLTEVTVGPALTEKQA